MRIRNTGKYRTGVYLADIQCCCLSEELTRQLEELEEQAEELDKKRQEQN
jgi:hypothetical protein